MPLTGKQIFKLAKKKGWKHVRTNGSHHIMEKDGRIETIPIHANKDLSKGLERSLLKSLGLKK